MSLTTHEQQTVTVVDPETGARIDVVVKAGKHALGKDPLQDAALNFLWATFLADDPDRPQNPAEPLLDLPGVPAPTDSAPAPTPAPAADTPTEG